MLDPCRLCRFAVSDNGYEGRCHRESPVMLRGSECAVWPKIHLDAPGCGKGKPIEPTIAERVAEVMR
jgi:hypothetical protein